MVKLQELVTLEQGIHQSRTENLAIVKNELGNTAEFYNHESFDLDMNSFRTFAEKHSNSNDKVKSYFVYAGDVIINLVKQKATIVSPANEGQLINLNFIKVDFNKKPFNKAYFVYCFNEDKGIKKQFEKSLQGSTLMHRLTKKIIYDINIPYLKLEEQQQVGAIYLKMLTLKEGYKELSRVTESFTINLIEKQINKLK